jgi:xanthine dehydrogenase YagT iron-sulfur-binding subunit
MGDSKGLSRRDLVRASLFGVVAARVAGTGGAEASPELVRQDIGPGPGPVRLDVNGKIYTIEVEPRVTLADALRDRIGLTGTKVVCARGACGACTVLADDAPVCSCLTLAVEAQGKKIRTVESLARRGKLDPLQEAFVACDALQCGFCTSGMLMSCKSLLEHNPHPSRRDIQEAVSGNLCRCGTYPHVFEAVERAAGKGVRS